MIQKIYKSDITCSWPPYPLTNCHTFSDPRPLSRAWRTLWTAPEGWGHKWILHIDEFMIMLLLGTTL